MNSNDEDCRTRLSGLATLRVRFAIHADLLPADLALAGLLDDLLEVSSASIDLAEESTRAVEGRQLSAYCMMRGSPERHGNPIQRPPMATVVHSESETRPASLLLPVRMPVSSARATTLRRTENVKTSTRKRDAIFTQKNFRK